MIKLTIGDWHHLQQLDYNQLPFKCRHCHEYGHFQKHHSKIQSNLKEKEAEECWKQSKRSRGNPKLAPRKEGKVPNPTANANKSKTVNLTTTKSGNSFAVL